MTLKVVCCALSVCFIHLQGRGFSEQGVMADMAISSLGTGKQIENKAGNTK